MLFDRPPLHELLTEAGFVDVEAGDAPPPQTLEATARNP